MINKHEHIYYEPLVDSIRMGKNILKPLVGGCGTAEVYLMLINNPCASVISAIDRRRRRLLNMVLSSSAGRPHQGKSFDKKSI